MLSSKSEDFANCLLCLVKVTSKTIAYLDIPCLSNNVLDIFVVNQHTY